MLIACSILLCNDLETVDLSFSLFEMMQVCEEIQYVLFLAQLLLYLSTLIAWYAASTQLNMYIKQQKKEKKREK